MKKLALVAFVFALVGAVIWFSMKEKPGSSAPITGVEPKSGEGVAGATGGQSAPGDSGENLDRGSGTSLNKKADVVLKPGELKKSAEVVSPDGKTSASPGGSSGLPAGGNTIPTGGKPSGKVSAEESPMPNETPAEKLGMGAPKKIEVKDGVDGNVASPPGDDGDLPPPAKVPPTATLAGIKSPIVWLVASDIRELPNIPAGKNSFEVGNAEGSKALPWKNRAGVRFGHAVKVKSSTTGTYIRGLETASGTFDAVSICAPGAKNCLGTQPTQLKVGLDVNHKDHWLSGPDKGKGSTRAASSFTVLFVAARASQNANPLLEHQNGESAGTKGVFLGWVGPDLVGSVRGLQGVVGVNAVSIPNPYREGIHPQIYTLRFDRKNPDVKLFSLSEKGGDVSGMTLPKNEAPDNDQYAAIAMGSKSPGASAVTYVFEQAAFGRALSDAEVCAIHKEWNQKYMLKIPAAKLKPCAE